MTLLVQLSRSIPLLIALAVIAGIIYLVVSYMRSPLRAKEILISLFTVLCSIIAGFFALVSLYAILDHNTPVLELAISFMIVGFVGLAVTLLCRHVFVKNHPNYKDRRQRTHTKRGPLWEQLLKLLHRSR